MKEPKTIAFTDFRLVDSMDELSISASVAQDVEPNTFTGIHVVDRMVAMEAYGTFTPITDTTTA